jgi:ankyrin repeat protein
MKFSSKLSSINEDSFSNYINEDISIDSASENIISLSQSIKAHDNITLESLLENQQFDLNLQDEFGQTLLHQSAIEGNLRATILLLNRGADINFKNYQDMTPLHLASFHNCNEILDLLLLNRADYNAVAFHGIKAIHIVASNGNCKGLESLIKYGANQFDLDDKGFDATDYLIQSIKKENSLIEEKLHQAINHGYVNVAELILKIDGTDINLEDDQGRTPLYSSAKKNNLEILKILLQKGADPNITEPFYLMPLNIAVEKNNLAMVELLLQYQAFPLTMKQKHHNTFFLLKQSMDKLQSLDPKDEEEIELNKQIEKALYTKVKERFRLHLRGDYQENSQFLIDDYELPNQEDFRLKSCCFDSITYLAINYFGLKIKVEEKKQNIITKVLENYLVVAIEEHQAQNISQIINKFKKNHSKVNKEMISSIIESICENSFEAIDFPTNHSKYSIDEQKELLNRLKEIVAKEDKSIISLKINQISKPSSFFSNPRHQQFTASSQNLIH